MKAAAPFLSSLAMLSAIAGPSFAQTMPSPAQQSELASSGVGVPLFVSATADLAAKEDTQMDSWFVISHLKSGQDTLDIMIHFIELTPPGREATIQGMVSVLDPASNAYIAEEKVFGPNDVTLSTDRLNVVMPVGTLTGTAEAMRVTGDFDRVDLDLTLNHQGPLLANVGNGLLPFYGDINYEYALPNMDSSGSVSIDGKVYTVTGTSWFDRQWGQMSQRIYQTGPQWTWFGMSLDDGTRISLWDIIDQGQSNAFAPVLHPDGRHELVDVEPVAEGATEMWQSPTGNRYPTRWVVTIPQLDASLTIVPHIREQEIVSPIGMHKYEGASSVTGTIDGVAVKGRAVAELVGNWR